MEIGSVKAQHTLEFQHHVRLRDHSVAEQYNNIATIGSHQVQHIFCRVETLRRSTISACEAGSKRHARALDAIYLCAEQNVY